MSTIVTRAGKGSALTHNEVDANFTNLNTDKVEKTGTDPVVISVNSASDALRITQTGAGNALVVEDSANPDSTPFVVDENGNLVVGHTSPIGAGQNTNIQSHATGGSAGISAFRWSDNTIPPRIQIGKSRGASVGTNAIVQSGDQLGGVYFYGDDGTDLVTQGASIIAEVDGTPGTNDMPGRLIFSTTADGASLPTERMRIGADGIARFGNASGTDENILQIIPTTGTDVTIRTNRTGTGVSHIPLKLQGGTGSPVEISITGGLSIPRTAVTSPVANDGNVFSGTYTPTLTNTTNITASTANTAYYTRVGNMVTVSGRVSIDPTATGSITLGVSLPIASDISNNCWGVCNNQQGDAIAVTSDNTNDRASFIGVVADAGNRVYSFTFQYQVV